MEKDMKRNIAIGFIIGFFLGWWWTRADVFSFFQKIIAMFFIGMIGAFFGYVETIAVRKRIKNIESGKKIKWWQKEQLSWKHWALIMLILFVAIIIAITIAVLL